MKSSILVADTASTISTDLRLSVRIHMKAFSVDSRTCVSVKGQTSYNSVFFSGGLGFRIKMFRGRFFSRRINSHRSNRGLLTLGRF